VKFFSSSIFVGLFALLDPDRDPATQMFADADHKPEFFSENELYKLKRSFCFQMQLIDTPQLLSVSTLLFQNLFSIK
jgi:hypothetical protein